MTEPNLDGISTQRIHPALDFTSDNAYVGQLLPCKNEYGGWAKQFCLIRDDGEIIPCIEEVLEKNGLSLSSPSFAFGNEWSIDGIKKFIKKPKAVDPAQLFNKIKILFKTYMELEDDKLYDFLTLEHWNLFLSFV